jgi:putative flippase GtrA
MTTPDLPAIRISAAVAARSVIEQDATTQMAGLMMPSTWPFLAVETVADTALPREGAEADSPQGLVASIRQHRLRLAVFALNGTAVFAAGLILQVVLVRYTHMADVLSYVIQTVTSVQMSFVLSRYLTWRDRDVAVLPALVRFNVQQFAVTGFGMVGYASLDRLGMNYIAANVAVTAVLTPVSFVTSHRWSMTPRKRIRLVARVPWPMLGILAVQAGLSLRLVWSNTAFQDEALYLWAGHLEWEHWLHGTPIAPAALPTYFSGAPVVYPPLGALADSIGGLAGARLLSLAFMLGATLLLYGTARRLFDQRTALFAIALFAGVGSTQFLGAFATYDAITLFLLALAAWLGVRAAHCGAFSATGLLLATAVVLGLADAAKYAAVLFDPVVIGATVLIMWQRRGRWATLTAGTLLVAVTGLLLAMALRLGGTAYWHGIEMTTLARSSSTVPAPGVLFISGKWVGAVALLALIGSAVSMTVNRWPLRLLACLLAGAVFLAPAEEARIHTLTSLFKHVGYGAWFGCIVAGYALSSLMRAVPAVKAAAAQRVGMAAVAIASISGIAYAGSHFAVWPNSSAYVRALRPWLTSSKGQDLVDNATVPEYYIGWYTGFDRITNSSYFAYTDPVTHNRIVKAPAAYADAIRDHFFAVISLTYGNAPTVYDPGIVRDIRKYGGYRLVSSVPYQTPTNRGYFLTWVRRGSA